MERGGTSIINQTLSTAPEFRGARGNLETFIFDDPMAVLGDDVRDMTREYLGGPDALEEFRAWFDSLTGWPEAWMEPRRIVSAYFYYVWQHTGSARILEKTPRHAFKLPLLVRFFPKCRIVGIHRHPLGVVDSYRKRLAREKALNLPPESYEWLDRTPQQICGHIQKIAVAMDEGLQKFPDHMMVVSYEELLRDPELTIGAICRFCNIEGAKVAVKSKASTSKKSGSDPLLEAGGIVTGNQFDSDLTLAEKLELFEQFPALFTIAAGMKRAA